MRGILLAAAGVSLLACHQPLPGTDTSHPAGGSAGTTSPPHIVGSGGTDGGGAGGTAGPSTGGSGGTVSNAVCPANAGYVLDCGCGCCGPPMWGGCYYPARGESVPVITKPPPVNCATAGCSAGARYFCCADSSPPEPTGGASYCVYDHATDNGLITVTKTVGDMCTRLHVIPSGANLTLPIAPGNWDVRASHGPCVEAGAGAIGALGSIVFGRGDGGATIDLHGTLFFLDATDVVTAVRMDVDALEFDPSGCQR